MCGLYGFLHYGNNKIKYLSNITNALAEEAAIRGTDATGIAFNDKGRLSILKESKSAYKLNFKHSDNITALIGHTRHYKVYGTFDASGITRYRTYKVDKLTGTITYLD